MWTFCEIVYNDLFYNVVVDLKMSVVYAILQYPRRKIVYASPCDSIDASLHRSSGPLSPPEGRNKCLRTRTSVWRRVAYTYIKKMITTLLKFDTIFSQNVPDEN